MKKVLIGLGIGCGVFILAGIGLMLAGGIWAKNKFGGSIEAMQAIQAQEQELTQLNASNSFKAPPEGQVLPLDEQRLLAYLTVRESALPAFKAFEAKSKEFEAQHAGDGDEKPGFNAAVDAASLFMGLMADVRKAYIAGLKAQEMSPAEFQSITTTVYASMVADSLDQIGAAAAQGWKMMVTQLAEVDKRLADDSLADEERAQLEEARAQLQETLDAIEEPGANEEQPLSEASKKAAAANVELLKKHKERVELMANVAFDGFVLGGAGADGQAAGLE
ncbi:hypothetical protein [Myxococcus virescens]|uniref:Uncharacterized protein n=1 Tax=Myxococcus virescens TaxID=83456 RepID=A0A511HKY5_9BACT|nr:hypothetical protein [Myxococcus virescens]GEL74236.1 hypothetical protein MVI01_60200 [Myxococcus virescens]SDD48250.1 hypothetical protein SAMN04488504_1011055 [Myxococcus virescens]